MNLKTKKNLIFKIFFYLKLKLKLFVLSIKKKEIILLFILLF